MSASSDSAPTRSAPTVATDPSFRRHSIPNPASFPPPPASSTPSPSRSIGSPRTSGGTPPLGGWTATVTNGSASERPLRNTTTVLAGSSSRWRSPVWGSPGTKPSTSSPTRGTSGRAPVGAVKPSSWVVVVSGHGEAADHAGHQAQPGEAGDHGPLAPAAGGAAGEGDADALPGGVDPTPLPGPLGQQVAQAIVGVAHGSMTSRRLARPRCRRDFTVPGRTPRRSAMSASERSS